MRVEDVGDIHLRGGRKVVGALLIGTREEIAALGHLLYREVRVDPVPTPPPSPKETLP